MSRLQDLTGILKSLQLITEASLKLQEENVKFIWKNSSLLSSLETVSTKVKQSSQVFPKNASFFGNESKECFERFSTVIKGISAYRNLPGAGQFVDSYSNNTNQKPSNTTSGNGCATVDLGQVVANKNQSLSKTIPIKATNLTAEKPAKIEYKLRLTEGDKELLRKLDMEHKAKLLKQADIEKKLQEEDLKEKLKNDKVKNVFKEEKGKEKKNLSNQPEVNPKKVVSVPNPKSKLKLSENAKQRKVPSSRIGRMVSFGTLAAGLGVGTAAEYAKRAFGLSDEPKDSANAFMSKANMERIVDTLCKVRGAALKLGQIMSIQDESIVNPELAKALERVRKSADFMPVWQLEQVMEAELGPRWRECFQEFEEKPFAAASIGQVHRGVMKDGQEVAIKVQYPGVAKGIESDIDNLGGIMKMWNIFPRGMFLDNLMSVAKRELAWEVNYVREAECTKKFRDLLEPYSDYYVPMVVENLSTGQVFTTEMLDGIPVDQCFDLDMEHKEFIGDKIMELCLLEILKFRYMQTDPNWANFLYNPNKKRILLLDFGASREYSKDFMDQYVRILKAACDGDRQTVLQVSKDLGFLTGYESKIMEEAHVDAVMILGEVFKEDGKYDFGNQDMTYRIQHLAEIMLTHRLCPPPEEVYSLHRKLSGVFLLCSKFKIKLACRNKFLKLYEEYVKENQIDS